MRTEKEMFDLILGFAKNDERVRAVYMNGSRTNPNVPKDIFQDYDIVYVVEETASFLENENWIDIFGELIIKQEPDKLDKVLGKDMDFSMSYTYLIQFTDGNRIDLHIETKKAMLKEYGNDKLTIKLLDKDKCLPSISLSTDEDYWVKKPSKEKFLCVCNEFWWVAPYSAKGLWRNEILFAIEMMNGYSRKELMTMLSCYVGINTNFSLSIGKLGKYLDKYLPTDMWERLLKTHDTKDYETTWNALIVMCELFDEVAKFVSKSLGFEYNSDEANKSFEFIKHIRQLPKDAENIY